MASDLLAMASNLLAVASNLIAMASNLTQWNKWQQDLFMKTDNSTTPGSVETFTCWTVVNGSFATFL